ncbi:DUF6896 domain-containing protein [Hymenobacter koreensis]|uniref:DUF6896 domain-containing protein n=1 Tax=Hymenobacter koreensis TaxID=1084523 RepID=A0ABP8J935_9BACT
MPFSPEEFVAIIRKYQAAVREAVGWLRRKDFSTTILALARRGRLDADGRAHYEFHGYGCLVTLPDGRSVDFDFGFDERFEEGRVDGFDPYFVVSYYAQHTDTALGTALQEASSALIAQLLAQGTVVRPDEQLYYFTEDWQNPSPPTYRPNSLLLEDVPNYEAWLRDFCPY